MGKTRIKKRYAYIARDLELSEYYESWRFNTFNDSFKAIYFEWWDAVDERKMDKWFLSRAYLNIYYFDKTKREEKEFLCLHSDPEESNNDENKYKRCPHLHIKIAGAPISKSHIAIGMHYISNIFSSQEEFFSNMSNTIELIRDEILNRC